MKNSNIKSEQTRVFKILDKVRKSDIPKDHCFHCKKPLGDDKRRKYHPGCVYDANKYDIKAKFKNHTYMYIYLGTGYEKGQGSRSGSLVKGSMSVASDMWSDPVPVTVENVKRSLKHHPYKINICNGAWLNSEDALLIAEFFDNM